MPGHRSRTRTGRRPLPRPPSSAARAQEERRRREGTKKAATATAGARNKTTRRRRAAERSEGPRRGRRQPTKDRRRREKARRGVVTDKGGGGRNRRDFVGRAALGDWSGPTRPDPGSHPGPRWILDCSKSQGRQRRGREMQVGRRAGPGRSHARAPKKGSPSAHSSVKWA